MSDANNKNTPTKLKQFNPTIAAMFEEPKFGDGAYLSVQINEESFKTIQQHIQIGSKLLLRKSKNKTATGNSFGFLEILPPREGYIVKAKPADTGNNSDTDV